MNPILRGAAAHVLVDDVDVPVLSDRAEHHVFRVLRVRDGEVVTVTDGRGAWRVCRAAGSAVTVDGDVEQVAPSTPIQLFVAIPKQDRPEWLVQKATELGADRIVFVHAERSVVRWDAARAQRHLAKLGTVAAEAAMQSRRVVVPVVEGPVRSFDVLAGAVAAEPGGRPVTPDDRSIAIGPEGGWTAAELACAAATVDLGPNILRVETAALAACAAIGAPAGF